MRLACTTCSRRPGWIRRRDKSLRHYGSRSEGDPGLAQAAARDPADGPADPTRASPASPAGEASEGPARPETRLPLYLPDPASPGGGWAGRSRSGTTVRVPAPAALPGGLSIQRALRPVKRRAADPVRHVLDEQETASASAEAGSVVPVLRAADERWLSLTLVVDSGPAMAAWAKLERELMTLLRRLGAFRDVQKWYLRTSAGTVHGVSRVISWSPPAASDPQRVSLQQLSRRAGIRDPAELISPAGPRVTLVLTDGASQAWYSGAMAPVLRKWGSAGPVAIVQPLPQQMWERTGLVPVQGRLIADSAAAPSVATRLRPPQGTKAIPIPVLGLGPQWLAPWARFIASPGGAALDCTVTLAAGAPRHLLPRPDLPGGAADRVKRFTQQASPQARQLAVYLSAIDLSLPVMRHVQAAMLPGSGPAHLAEVLLSGLLSKTASTQNPDMPEEWRYEFAPGVREMLQASLGRTQARRILAQVSRDVTARFGRAADEFTATLAAPATTAGTARPAGAPFAEVAAEVIERVTGRLASPVAPQPPIAMAGDPSGRAAALIRRYLRAGRVSDLDEAITALRGAAPAGLPGHAGQLALALRLRFAATGQLTDLDEAEELLAAAVTGAPDGPDRAELWSGLSAVHGLRYARSGDLADLDAATDAARSAVREAMAAGPDDHVPPRYSADLGGFLLRRARATGAAADLAEAVSWLRTATATQPLEAAERARILADLAAALRLQAGALPDAAAQAAGLLDAAVRALGEALAHTTADTAQQAARLAELGATLMDAAIVQQAAGEDSAATLATAADSYRAAAAIRAASTRVRAESLARLGIALCEMASRGDSAVPPEAVRSLRLAVAQTPDDDPELPGRLAALARAQLLRSESSDYRGELTEATLLLAQAAAAAPAGSQQQAEYFAALGAAHERRYARSLAEQDLTAAASAYRAATAIPAVQQRVDWQYALGRILNSVRRYREAANVLADVVDRLNSGIGQAGAVALDARLALANALAGDGRIADAGSVLDDLIPLQDRVLGTDHPDTRAARALRATLVKGEES